MKPKKPKPTEPSVRDKLSASFLKAFQADFESYGIEAIEKLRVEESPAKYAEIAARLITATEPKSEEPKDVRSLAIRELKDVGAFEVTEDMIEQTIKAGEEHLDKVLAIKAAAEGAMQ